MDAAKSVGFPGYPTTPSARAYDWFSIQYIGLVVPLAAVQFGVRTGLVVAVFLSDAPLNAPTLRALEKTGVVLAVLTALAIILNAAYRPTATSLALCFAPLGALARFTLALHLNASAEFKWGTFWANMAGSFAMGGSVLAQTLSSASFPRCDLLTGFEEGFCGSLTTVSTFVFELQEGLGFASAVRYLTFSLITAQLGLLLMFGLVIASFGPDSVFPQGTCLTG